MKVDKAIERIITGFPKKVETSKEEPIVQGVSLTVDINTGECLDIERFSYPLK
jgi:calcineurin-like phosphoesterase